MITTIWTSSPWWYLLISWPDLKTNMQMNKLMYSRLMAGMISFAACGQSGEEAHDEKASGVEQNEAGGYGKVVTPDNPVALTDLMDDMDKANGFQGQVTGTVVASCQNKGCWMTLDGGNGQTMMVSFKDYGFFVPMDMAGKQVVIEGIAEIRTVGVDEQRHLAQDGGASEEEINAITEEKQELSFVADGVVVI